MKNRLGAHFHSAAQAVGSQIHRTKYSAPCNTLPVGTPTQATPASASRVCSFIIIEIEAKSKYLCYNGVMFKCTLTPKQKLNLSRLFYACLIIALFCFYRCPFLFLWGIPCPGCGMTRAFLALLHLDFAAAFYYHPLFPVVIFYILRGIFALYKKKHPAFCAKISARLPLVKRLPDSAPEENMHSFLHIRSKRVFPYAKMRRILLVLTCALFFLVYFIRLFSGSDVVRTDFENALIWKLIFDSRS